MHFLIVTGMSGAGKSTVLKFLEDAGYFCVDNLPPSLIPKFAEICYRPGSDIKQVALGIDVRGGKLFEDVFAGLEALSRDNLEYTILFLDASDETLVKRYKETRHSHPLAKNERVITGIDKEREMLSEVKKRASFIIDTSNTLTRQLKEMINEIIIKNKKFNSLMITVLSFGFKYGIPDDSDLVFDVRFIPNPFYIQELKEKTGLEAPVRSYVMKLDATKGFLEKWIDMLNFLIPHYVNEGKNQLVISVGCTGGKHRSVALAEWLFMTLQNQGLAAVINHRDIDKDSKRL
ncbi:MAG: RNase adapter RapZ [Clostridiales bacterium]|jgi:UPF0042 nucleotide-binding protein|nr:RNase adapter RapZ [Clostridiales bacterium]